MTNPDNWSVSSCTVHCAYRQCYPTELHSSSEVYVYRQQSVPTALLVLTMGDLGLLCLDVPVGVLVYCYAMRSDRYNQGRVESHPRAGCTWLCLPHSVWCGTTMGVCSWGLTPSCLTYQLHIGCRYSPYWPDLHV